MPPPAQNSLSVSPPLTPPHPACPPLSEILCDTWNTLHETHRFSTALGQPVRSPSTFKDKCLHLFALGREKKPACPWFSKATMTPTGEKAGFASFPVLSKGKTVKHSSAWRRGGLKEVWTLSQGWRMLGWRAALRHKEDVGTRRNVCHQEGPFHHRWGASPSSDCAGCSPGEKCRTQQRGSQKVPEASR